MVEILEKSGRKKYRYLAGCDPDDCAATVQHSPTVQADKDQHLGKALAGLRTEHRTTWTDFEKPEKCEPETQLQPDCRPTPRLSFSPVVVLFSVGVIKLAKIKSSFSVFNYWDMQTSCLHPQ